MSWEGYAKCDECGGEIGEGDTTVCEKCLKELQQEIERLENRIIELENPK